MTQYIYILKYFLYVPSGESFINVIVETDLKKKEKKKSIGFLDTDKRITCTTVTILT